MKLGSFLSTTLFITSHRTNLSPVWRVGTAEAGSGICEDHAAAPAPWGEPCNMMEVGF